MSATPRLVAALADRYRIEGELGAGGMATVYLAHDVKHDRKVAVKVLRAELAAVIGAERFLAEIKTTANLQHPHILPLHDSGQVDGTVFYVMPLVEGESLRDRLQREKQLPVADAVRITTEVASALDYAHRHGVIHRDIKPENVLLHDGQALIADFGIALAASNAGSTRMTETGMSLGTPHYMSPEQAMGERTIDARTDVYSLGAVLYELLTGEPPHSGTTAQAIVAKVLSETPTPVSRTRSFVPPNVEAALLRALAKTPADRFATAAEFAAALANPAFALPTGTVSAAVAPRAGLWNPLSIGMSVAAAALAVSAFYFASQPSAVAAAGASRQRVVLPVDEPWTVGLGLSIAPGDSAIAFTVRDSAGFRIWVKRRDQVRPTVVPGSEGAVTVGHSPDGKWLVFVAGDKLRKISVAGGTALTLSDSAQTLRPSAAWVDDSTIVYTSAQFSVVSVSATGSGTRRVLLSSADSAFARSAVAVTAIPGTTGLLVTGCLGGCAQIGVWIFDIATREATLLDPDAAKAWYVNSGHVVFVRRDGAVYAAPFDVKTLRVVGPPAPMFDGVRVSVGVADLAISPSGTVIYAAGAAGGSEYFVPVWVTRDGRVAAVDSAWSLTPGPNAGLALSPDGRNVAISEQGPESGDIWVKRLDRGPRTRLTTGGTRNFRPYWSKDGNYVSYLSDQISPAYDLFRVRSDGSSPPELVMDTEERITEALGSPDGAWLVLRTGGFGGQAGGRRVAGVKIGSDSAPVTLFSQGQFDVKAIALSPDGKWLAYESTESGPEQVFIRPFPNGNDWKVQVSARGGFGPLWSRSGRERSGRELFYLNGALEMVVVTVTAAGSRVQVSDEQTLFPTSGRFYRSLNHRGYDVSPDDRRFFMLELLSRSDPAAAPVDIVLIENWLTEVRALASK